MRNDLSGSHAADLMGVDHDSMYKTLVLKGEKKGYLVCCIPVDEAVDLKLAAKAAGEKKVEMIHDEGHAGGDRIHSGRLFAHRHEKRYPTYIEETAQLYDAITVSAGQRGRADHPVAGGAAGVCGRRVCAVNRAVGAIINVVLQRFIEGRNFQ